MIFIQLYHLSKFLRNSVSAIVLFVCCNSGVSQIIYTNIEPDTTQVGSLINYMVDMNNDGINDLGFSYSADASVNDFGSVDFLSKTINVDLMNLTRICGKKTASYNAMSLDSNDIINDDKLWLLMESLRLTSTYYHIVDGELLPTSGDGYWGDEDNFYYLGVRFWSNNFYYGWVRLKVDQQNMALTVSDYAYNAIPEEEIKAGYKGGKLHDLMAIYNANNITVFLPEYTLETNAVVQLFNISGQLLFNGAFINNKQITINAELLPSGIYIINAYNDLVSRTAKIVIEK